MSERDVDSNSTGGDDCMGLLDVEGESFKVDTLISAEMRADLKVGEYKLSWNTESERWMRDQSYSWISRSGGRSGLGKWFQAIRTYVVVSHAERMQTQPHSPAKGTRRHQSKKQNEH